VFVLAPVGVARHADHAVVVGGRLAHIEDASMRFGEFTAQARDWGC
jgi:hypothetical protein